MAAWRLTIGMTIMVMMSTGVIEGAARGVQREFDYFKLTLQWPGTRCQRTRHCCSSNACCHGSNSPMKFTIHGLWPDYNDGTWPACCQGARYNQKDISSLNDPLVKYWPSLSCAKSSTCHGSKGSFWAHEWEKHGTCSYPVFRDEYSYFLATINLYMKYNVTKVLLDEGFIPSDTEKYPLGGIVSAIENVFRATPHLSCSQGALEELQLCFYKDFKPRNCVIGTGGSLNSSSNSCPKYISLPTYASLGLGNEKGKATRYIVSE